MSLWYARVSFHLREQQVQIEECCGQDEIFQKAALLEDLRLHFCNPYTSYTDNTMKREDLDEDECCTDLDKLEQRPVVWIRLSNSKTLIFNPAALNSPRDSNPVLMWQSSSKRLCPGGDCNATERFSSPPLVETSRPAKDLLFGLQFGLWYTLLRVV